MSLVQGRLLEEVELYSGEEKIPNPKQFTCAPKVFWFLRSEEAEGVTHAKLICSDGSEDIYRRVSCDHITIETDYHW